MVRVASGFVIVVEKDKSCVKLAGYITKKKEVISNVEANVQVVAKMSRTFVRIS